MKVLVVVSLTLPLHFAHCQAHYLISLAAFHCDISLSELKANLERHTGSEICDGKKSNQMISPYLKYGQKRCCFFWMESAKHL